MRRRAALLGAALAVGSLLLCRPAGADWPTDADAASPEARLYEWMKAKGAAFDGFAMGQACPTCPRGLVASKDLEEGDTIMKIPFSLALVLGLEEEDVPDMAASYARDLLIKMHTDPAWNETWSFFWASQPAPEDVFTPEVWEDSHLELLQAPTIAKRALWHREVTEEVYNGTYEYYNFTALPQLVPAVDMQTFKWIATRYFGRRYHNETDLPHLVPLLEMANHAEDPNAERSDDDDFVYLKALQPIRKGEEITISYKPDVLHRPDMSLYSYGFVVDRDRPFLAALDVLGFDPRDFFRKTAEDDSGYESGGELAVEEEYHRLSARLNSLPTTEEEDRELLESGNLTGWDRTILTFRIQRKRALQNVLDTLQASLGHAEGEEAAGEGGEEDDEREEDDDEEEENKDEL